MLEQEFSAEHEYNTPLSYCLQDYISDIRCITWPPDAQLSLVKQTVSAPALQVACVSGVPK